MYLRKVDLWNEMGAVWTIFKDCLHMFSDTALKCAGHSVIDDKYKLYDLFYWGLKIPRNPFVGYYNDFNKLVGFVYVTNIYPVEPLPYRKDYYTEDEYLDAMVWEGSYHASMHPAYRSPKYSTPMVKVTTDYFIHNYDITHLFSFLRVDNRPANLALMRTGFEHIDFMKGYRVHGGEYVDYNLYLYRG